MTRASCHEGQQQVQETKTSRHHDVYERRAYVNHCRFHGERIGRIILSADTCKEKEEYLGDDLEREAPHEGEQGLWRRTRC